MENILLNLLLVHITLCVLYLIFLWKSKFYMTIFPIILFVPYISYLVLFIVFIYSKIKKNKSEYDKDEVFLETNKMSFVSQINEEKEKNIIPIEEALIINDHLVQRRMVMEVSKRAPDEYINELKEALLSPDTETAHYAASSISELKRQYDKALIQSQNIYEHNPDSHGARKMYIEALDNILMADLNLETINQGYKEQIVKILEEDLQETKIPTEEEFVKLINYLVELANYNEAKEWLKKYHDTHTTSNKMLRMQMNMAYKMKDNNMFKKAIEEIENADFTITDETLDMVKFWKKEKFV